VAAPLGSFLGQYIGWRGSFFLVVPLAVLAFAWQWASIPAMHSEPSTRSSNPFRLLGNSQVALGMLAIMLLFMGQFSVFTYLRPFLETVTQVSVTTLSLMLLLLGIFGVIGTYLIGSLLQQRLYAYLIGIPLSMAIVAAVLIAFGSSTLAVGLLLAAWGLVATPAPVAWGLWLSKTLPDDAEAGGGLMVATIQMAITLGAGLGGFMFDAMGWWSPFAFGVAVLVSCAAFAWAALRNAQR